MYIRNNISYIKFINNYQGSSHIRINIDDQPLVLSLSANTQTSSLAINCGGYRRITITSFTYIPSIIMTNSIDELNILPITTKTITKTEAINEYIIVQKQCNYTLEIFGNEEIQINFQKINVK